MFNIYECVEQLEALRNALEIIDVPVYLNDTHEQMIESIAELITRTMKYVIKHSELTC